MEGEFDFDESGGVNLHDILNDADLNRELIELGWNEEPKKSSATKQTQVIRKAVSVKETLQTAHGVDISSIGQIDEVSMTLTADDMQDPELLKQFDILSKGQENENLIDFDSPVDIIPVSKSVEHAQKVPVAKQSANPATAAEAKQLALKYKREGNNEEALKWYRLAKELDASSVASSTTTSNVSSTKTAVKLSASSQVGKVSAAFSQDAKVVLSQSSSPASIPSANNSDKLGDPFSPLELAINEAMQAALREAKANEHTNKPVAIAKMKEYKRFQQELGVLQSRRQIGGASPAVFKWHTVQTQVKVENTEIGEDQIKVFIDGAFNLESVLDSHNSRSISVQYNLGLNKDDESMVCIPQAKYEGGRVVFNYSAIVNGIKRGGKLIQQTYARKKATFELILHRGFFKSNCTLGAVILPLQDLLSKSEIGGALPLVATGAEGTGTKKGKALGGTVNITLKLRTPLMTPEVRIVEERTLVIEPWPAITPLLPTPVASPTPQAPSQPPRAVSAEPGIASRGSELLSTDDQMRSKSATSASTSQLSSLPASAPAANPMSNPLFQSISERDKLDPFNVDLLESSDVMDAEIAEMQSQLSSGKLDEDVQFATNMRLQLVKSKMQILVYQVQNETLSLEQYLSNLKERVKKDQTLALYFKTLASMPTPAKKLDALDADEEPKDYMQYALRIMKRVKLMKDEIKNAEEASIES